jgi:hypothetical protein
MSEQTGSILQPEGHDRKAERKNARDNLIHAGEFTRIENTAGIGFLRGWIAEDSRQDDEIIKAADDVWALTVLLEHFTSELNSDPTTRTRESRAVLVELEARAKAAQDHLKELTQDDDDADDDVRMNELTDRTVQEVLQKLGL